MDTLILGVTYIRRSALEHPNFLHFREIVSVYDDDICHLVEVRRYVHLFLFIWSRRFSTRRKGKLYYVFLTNGQGFEFTVVKTPSLNYLCSILQEKTNHHITCFLMWWYWKRKGTCCITNPSAKIVLATSYM